MKTAFLLSDYDAYPATAVAARAVAFQLLGRRRSCYDPLVFIIRLDGGTGEIVPSNRSWSSKWLDIPYPASGTAGFETAEPQAQRIEQNQHAQGGQVGGAQPLIHEHAQG